MSKKGEIWSDEECLALLCAWGDEEIQKKLGGTHKNADVYQKISKMMKESGDFNRDWKQCRTKIKHLKDEYKKHKDSLSRSGAGRGKEPKFFGQMDYFLGDKPEALGLEKSVDTSTASEDSTSIDLDTNLVEKYGNGISVEKHCPKCNEKVEVKTSGVHFGENNCIAVYSDDEKLVCPNCNYTEVNHQEEEEETPVNNQKTADSAAEITKSKLKPAKKGKPTKMQAAFENAMAGYTKYQKESDQMFASQMKDQFEKEAEMRKEELNAYTASMGLLANAIAGRHQIVQQHTPHYQIQHDIQNQQIYYKL